MKKKTKITKWIRQCIIELFEDVEYGKITSWQADEELDELIEIEKKGRIKYYRDKEKRTNEKGKNIQRDNGSSL